MKTDLEIQKDVMAELEWEPYLKASEIGVAVTNGIVSLSGRVDSYRRKVSVDNAAKRVPGVKVVVDDLVVGVSPCGKKTDTEIAEAVLNALKYHPAVHEGEIKIKVENGVVRLEGEVNWEYERNSAKLAIVDLPGVNGVINMISVKPRVAAADIERRIKDVLIKNAALDASGISITVHEHAITLKGKVRSRSEEDDAENVAWDTPGVDSVENELDVEEMQYALET